MDPPPPRLLSASKQQLRDAITTSSSARQLRSWPYPPPPRSASAPKAYRREAESDRGYDSDPPALPTWPSPPQTLVVGGSPRTLLSPAYDAAAAARDRPNSPNGRPNSPRPARPPSPASSLSATPRPQEFSLEEIRRPVDARVCTALFGDKAVGTIGALSLVQTEFGGEAALSRAAMELAQRLLATPRPWTQPYCVAFLLLMRAEAPSDGDTADSGALIGGTGLYWMADYLVRCYFRNRQTVRDLTLLQLRLLRTTLFFTLVRFNTDPAHSAVYDLLAEVAIDEQYSTTSAVATMVATSTTTISPTDTADVAAATVAATSTTTTSPTDTAVATAAVVVAATAATSTTTTSPTDTATAPVAAAKTAPASSEPAQPPHAAEPSDPASLPFASVESSNHNNTTQPPAP